jgi:glycosyltransferase involved in cell wall biosynthesis
VFQDTIAAALDDSRVERLTVFCSPASLRTFEMPRSRKLTVLDEPVAERAVMRPWWYEFGLPHRVSQVRPDVLLCLHSAGLSPRGIGHVTFVQRPLRYTAEARAVVAVSHRYRTPFLRPLIRHSCRTAKLVLVQSPSMRREVEEVCRIPASRIEVVSPAPRRLPRADQDQPMVDAMRAVPSDRRFLFVGHMVTHKNVARAMEAVELARCRYPDARLFLTGPPAHDIAIGPGTVALGYTSEAALAQAYELATALVMPSLHETVGLPMLEAMDAGTPVLAADRPYARDACENAALFFDPLDSRSISHAMERIIIEPSTRARLAAAGRELVERRRGARPYHRLVDAAVRIGMR